MHEILKEYKVTQNGEFTRMKKLVQVKRWHGKVIYSLKERRLSPTKNKLVYYQIRLGGRDGKNYYVHRILATLFVPNPLNKPYINHIDNNPSNNKLENLEWSTQKENIKHSSNQGRMPKGDLVGNSKLKWSSVSQIRELSDSKTQTELGQMFAVKQTTISRILNNKIWKI